MRLALALASLGAAVIRTVQIFLRSAEQAANHKGFATRFAEIESRIDMLLANLPGKGSFSKEIEAIRMQISTVASYVPFVKVENVTSIISPTR